MNPSEEDWAALRNACKHIDLPTHFTDRVGFMNTDSFFGFSFPESQDEFEREVDGPIPEGKIKVLFGYGDPHQASVLLEEGLFFQKLGH